MSKIRERQSWASTSVCVGVLVCERETHTEGEGGRVCERDTQCVCGRESNQGE